MEVILCQLIAKSIMGFFLPTLLEVITYELTTSIERSRCPVGSGMTGRVVIRRLKDGGSQKPCRPLRTEGGDAKQPPEIGLLTTTVRKPEDRCPACAGHDERDALHALVMTEEDSTDGPWHDAEWLVITLLP